jgi:hypothetical protein
MTQASRIIDKFGGKAAFQEQFKISDSRLYRWLIPEAKGGTGGRIPAKHQQQLLDLAREQGVDLKPDDFFDQEVE